MLSRTFALLFIMSLLAGPAAAQTLRLDQLPVPADALQKRMALDAFSAYRCSDCEGGKGYDTWAAKRLGVTGQGAWNAKVGDLPVGGVITWKGVQATGELKVVSENPVAGYQCKQMLYTIKKGDQSASRDGMFCLSKPRSSEVQPRWSEIY